MSHNMYSIHNRYLLTIYIINNHFIIHWLFIHQYQINILSFDSQSKHLIGPYKTNIKPIKTNKQTLKNPCMPTKQRLIILFYILSYFTISIGLGFFSSYYLSSKNYNFRFPLFITSMQNVIHFILSNIVILCMQTNSTLKKTTSLKNIIRKTLHKESIKEYFLTTLPCAISAAIDIGIGSYALRTVSLAYYTMIKSSSPVFVLLCGFIFGIEKPSIKLFLVVFVIGIGVFLTTVKTEMSHIKICLSNTTFMLLFASFMGGFKWAFIQYIIQKKNGNNGQAEDNTKQSGITNKNRGKIENIKNHNKETDLNNNDKENINNKHITEMNDNNSKIDFYNIRSGAQVDSKEFKQTHTEQFHGCNHINTDNDYSIFKNNKQSKNNDPEKVTSHCEPSIDSRTDTELNPNDENAHPTVVFTIRSLCVPIGCFLFLFSCIFEGMFTIFTSEFFKNSHSIKINTGYILLTGILTFTLLVSEFLLVSQTSVIFLSVCGIVKELMIVFISVCRKDITFEGTNYLGLVVSIFGMVLYNYTRMKK